MEVRRAGVRIGTAVAGGSNVSVPIRFVTPAAPGDTLEAFQAYTPPAGATVSGPMTPSLPLQAAPPGEPPAPVLQPPYECDLAVLVSQLQEGASLVVKHNADELAGYPFVGTPVWAQLVKPVRGADQLSARQRAEQCRRDGGFSAPVGALTPLKLPTPVLVGPVCPNAQLVRVRGLRPGALVTIFADKVTSSGSAGAQVGQARAWATDCDFALPAGWSDHPQLTSHPGSLILKVWQEACDRGSDPATLPVEPLPGLVGTPGMAKPVECARLIAASTLTPGAVVVVRSDQSDSPLLTGPVPVTASNMAIGLYRPLRAHEHVSIDQSGCGAAATSASTEVDPFPGIGAPFIAPPVRIPHGGILLKKLIVGARVHVFVNGLVMTSFDATDTSLFVPVPGLTREAVVVVRQTMCTKISDESNRETATFGELALTQAPKPIVRTRPTSVTVTATDRDNGTPVSGTVKIGAAAAGATGVAFAFTFPAGPAPASSVEAPNYVSAAIAWDLQDPPPVAPALLHLGLVNQASSFFTITSVTWTIVRQELNGTLTPVASPTGTSSAIHLPSTGQYQLRAEVAVDDLVNGGNVLSEFRGNTTVQGEGRQVFVWSNVDLSQNFRLFAEPTTIWGGGTAYTVYNPVVAP